MLLSKIIIFQMENMMGKIKINIKMEMRLKIVISLVEKRNQR